MAWHPVRWDTLRSGDTPCSFCTTSPRSQEQHRGRQETLLAIVNPFRCRLSISTLESRLSLLHPLIQLMNWTE